MNGEFIELDSQGVVSCPKAMFQKSREYCSLQETRWLQIRSQNVIQVTVHWPTEWREMVASFPFALISPGFPSVKPTFPLGYQENWGGITERAYGR